MFFTPSAAAPSRSACRPMMFRSLHEMWETTSMPASSCTILAAATGCILSLARAPWEIHLHRHGEAGAQPLGELRDGFGGDFDPLFGLHHGCGAANPGGIELEV